MDWFPLRLSLQVSILATVLTVAFGVPLAWALGKRRFVGRELLGAVILTPLVLPPTVLGYYLLVLIASGGPIGGLLDRLGIELAFTWRAAVLAGCVGSLPLLVRSVQAGFETVDERLEQAARTLGRTETSIFFTITLPLAWRAVVAGTLLAFARGFGDFGMTLMVAGNIPRRTQTLPLAIYDHVQANQMHEANGLALVAVGLVVLLLFGVGRWARVRY
jgi:molybdate transport system permease protein